MSLRPSLSRVRSSIQYRSRSAAVAMVTGPGVRALRGSAARARYEPGITVIAVNFNTLAYLMTMVAAIRYHSPLETRIIVVDNASSDGSLEWLRTRDDVQTVRLPVNVNHGPGMDIGILRCRTEYFVALDIDAFPIDDDWLEEIIRPLRSGARVSGASIPFEDRETYIHACCLAMETARFVDCKHTFAARQGHWDTAQRISQIECRHLHPIPLTSCRGPGLVGSVFGNIVYHNFYSARFAATHREVIDEGGEEDSIVVTVDDASLAWNEALTKYMSWS